MNDVALQIMIRMVDIMREHIAEEQKILQIIITHNHKIITRYHELIIGLENLSSPTTGSQNESKS